MAGVGVAPPPNHPPTSLAVGGSTRARHPGPSIARARCGRKRYPGCRSVPLPPKSPDCHSRQSPPNSPFLIARYDDARAKPTHARALRRWRRSLARSIARAVCGGCGGGGGRLIARHARYARCVSRACTRASSTRIARVIAVFHPPPCTTGTRALQRRRRSLAPSIARARCGGGDGDA